MGGDNKTPQLPQDPPAITPPWLQNARPTTLPQGAPGQLEGLARDLAGGGFGTQKADMSYLDQIYNPSQSMQFGAPPAKPAAAPAAAPVKPATAPTLPSVGGGSYQLVDGKFVLVPGTHNTGYNSR